jgi:hypothetical protein
MTVRFRYICWFFAACAALVAGIAWIALLLIEAVNVMPWAAVGP